MGQPVAFSEVRIIEQHWTAHNPVGIPEEQVMSVRDFALLELGLAFLNLIVDRDGVIDLPPAREFGNVLCVS